MAIKPTGNPPVSIPVQTPTEGPQAKTPAAQVQPGTPINPEAVAKALKDYRKLWDKLKKPFLSGAAGLFTDNITFPEELLDTSNPANDVKYLHLLCALFGLKEMERFFSTEEQREENEELEKQMAEEEAEKSKKASPKLQKPIPRSKKK